MFKQSPEELEALIQAARDKAFVLYEGKQVPHRSCGIAIAETFNVPTMPYQALRKGGILGLGECGAIKGGELLLGEILGDPDPTGAVTPALREAMERYRREWIARVDRKDAAKGDRDGIPNIICNHMTGQFDDFMGPERQSFCTHIAAEVAQIVAEILVDQGVDLEIGPIEPPEPHPSPK